MPNENLKNLKDAFAKFNQDEKLAKEFTENPQVVLKRLNVDTRGLKISTGKAGELVPASKNQVYDGEGLRTWTICASVGIVVCASAGTTVGSAEGDEILTDGIVK